MDHESIKAYIKEESANKIGITTNQLAAVSKEVAQKMGINEMWPGHPKEQMFFSAVLEKIKQTNG